MPATQTFRTNAKRYELISPIQEGPAASVWHARDTIAGVDVVVKQLNGGHATDPIARARLREEAEIADRISHPGAVPVIDTVFREDQAALVFPYVSGRTLAERMRDQPSLTHREAAQIALDLADVLTAAHAAGVVHRDIKPANILIGEDGRIRLLDFGIATSERPLELTGSGMAIGTLPYMAPEQLTGSNPSPSADVFGLGVVLYEMIAGRRPFNGNSPAEQLRLQNAAPAPLEAPDALAALVAAMLSQIPSERPSAEQVGRTLRGWLDGRYESEAVTATFVAAAAGSWRPFAPMAGVGLALIGLLLLGAVTLVGFGSSPGAIGPSGQPTPPAVAVQSEPTTKPTRAPTPPPAATTANQPTATRSGTNLGSTPPKADKKEGGHEKHGDKKHGHKGKKGRH